MRPSLSSPNDVIVVFVSSRVREEGSFVKRRNAALELRIVDRLVAIERAVDRRQRGFQAGGAIEQHHAVTLRDASVGEAVLVGGVGRSAFGAQQQPLLARDLVQRRRDLVVVDSNGKALALAYRAQNEKVADRLRHADA